MTSPETVVRDLLAHLAADEVEEAIELLDVDVVWKNTYLPTFRGPQVAKNLRDMVTRGISFDVTIHHLAATGGVVLTDRTDVLSYGAWSSDFWVRGTFEVRDGKVVLWDDAFSWIDVMTSGIAGLVSGGAAQRSSARHREAPWSHGRRGEVVRLVPVGGIEWRTKWERDWDRVRSLLDRMSSARRHGRRTGPWRRRSVDLLARRGSGTTICPSDAPARSTARTVKAGASS